MKIIRAKQTNKEYQYSAYKVGWVFEVVNEYEDHYVAKVLSGSKEHLDRDWETFLILQQHP